MGEIITIGESVGTGGSNLAPDVAKIGAALVTIGPHRGGVNAVPLSINALGDAIKHFQNIQKLPVRDGKVDKNGNTIKRINAILKGGVLPIPPSPIIRSGAIRNLPEMIKGVNRSVDSPIESSLTSDWVMKWGTVGNGGVVHYFELDEDVAPNWFGVLVPNGVKSFDHIHLFFHPTPSNRQIDDRDYKTQGKGRFTEILHYLNDDALAIQFCAAQTGQILIMPLMTQGIAETCGILPQRWESIFLQILGQLASLEMYQMPAPTSISSLVVSSFSNGITYSSAFRSRASLGGKLRGIIDFDGIISQSSSKSLALPPTALRFWQSGVGGKNLFAHSAANLFPLPLERWQEYPNKGIFKGDFRYIMYMIHGTIPQTMMHFAARRTAPQ